MADGSGVPPGKYSRPAPRCIGRHFADEIGPVRGPQRCNCKKVVDRWIRTVPIVPGNEARIVGFKTGTEERRIANQKMFEQQDATIPNCRPFSLETGEVFIYFRAVNCGKFPRPGLRRNLYAIQVKDFSAACIARKHVQVSLAVCRQVVDDNDLFIALEAVHVHRL